MRTQEKINKLNSVILCLQAHPDNEKDSEFEDRISDLEEIVKFEKQKTDIMMWKSTSIKNPSAYETGHWDGKKSDLVLCEDKKGCYHLAYYYEGVLDGSKFEDWYDKNDNELSDIVQYLEITPF